MARNVEIKARIASLELLLARARTLADGPPETIAQDDTFFACAHGRLKLRDFSDGRGELIAYERPDRRGPRSSCYRITPTADPQGLRDTLAGALGVIGRVQKQRLLLRVGRTRVHLDRVERLGDFVELEVVLHDGEGDAEGIAEACHLMQALGIDAVQSEAGAYLDLLAAQAGAAPR